MAELTQFIGKKASFVSLSASRQVCELELAACFRGDVLLFSRSMNVFEQSIMQLGRCFQVCFKLDNLIYRYHAKVTRVCNGPYLGLKLMLLGQGSETREPRLKIAKKGIKIILQEGHREIVASLADISISGAKLISRRRLGFVGETLHIVLPNRGVESHLHLPCNIRYVRSEIHSSQYEGAICFHHGVEFLDLSATVEDFLLQFVG